MRLLLVEDDLKIAHFIFNGLKEAGFAVDHMTNGEDGLHMALTEPYDIAVIDIMLPKLDGLTLIEEMRKNKINTPVLILSAKRTVDDRVRGLKTGGDDYLTKPFAFSELLARVQALIRRASGLSSPSGLTVGDLTLDLQTRKVVRAREKIESANRDERVNIPVYQRVKRKERVPFRLRNLFKNISDSPNCVDEFFIKISINFIPQATYSSFNYVRLRIKIIIPYVFHNHGF